IEAKPEDIARQDYPPDKLQNMVADSALTEDIPDKLQHNHQDAKKSTEKRRNTPHHSYNTLAETSLWQELSRRRRE
ncbi:MAG: hypothetical protein ACP5G1_04855, partial [Nanopusillaceae archaeon]